MWGRQVLLGILGLSFGMGAAAGMFAFIIGLGVISDFADRTHTGKYILWYEDCLMLGGVLGNILWIYEISIPYAGWFLVLFGLFSGIFVGCWSMALAEALNIFPIFIRRVKLESSVPYLILATALGKGIASLVFFINRW